MSNRELAENLIDQIPEELPNAETLAAMSEIEEIIKTGSGQHFQGTAEEFTNMLLS